jgi:hypothetical protein
MTLCSSVYPSFGDTLLSPILILSFSIDLRETGYEGVHWIYWAQDRDQW